MVKNDINDPRMEKCPWLIPYLTVMDATKALEFYQEAYGFSKGTVMKGDKGEIQHAEMLYQDQVIIMFSPESLATTPDSPPCRSPKHSKMHVPINLYVYAFNVDELFERARDAGAKVVQEPSDMVWGDRIAQFEDPDGYRWTFATNKKNFNI